MRQHLLFGEFIFLFLSSHFLILLYRHRNDIACYIDDVLDRSEKYFGIDCDGDQIICFQEEGNNEYTNQDRARLVRCSKR